VSDDVIRRVINFGMKAKPVVHGTPFGHGEMTIHVDKLPMPIGEQMTRHRVMRVSKAQLGGQGDRLIVDIDWQPNISKKSFRYVSLSDGRREVASGGRQMSHAERAEELFYVPATQHIYGQDGRPGNYVRVPLSHAIQEAEQERFRRVYANCLREYEEALEAGLSFEQARFLLPQGAYTRLYATESYRNWFNFCLARNDEHAQQEIRWLAAQVESILEQVAPITYELWISHGRRMI
jgi:flavin-dependent thymidylate synthase